MPRTRSIKNGSFPFNTGHGSLASDNTFVQVALLAKGDNTEPTRDHAIMCLKHWGHITIVNAVDGNDYVAVIAGTSFTYSAQSGDTQEDIVNGLIDLIDLNTTLGITAAGARQLPASNQWRFWISRDSAFTLANTGSTVLTDVVVNSGNSTDASATGNAGGTSITTAPLQYKIPEGAYITFRDDLTKAEEMIQLSASTAAAASADSQVLAVESIPQTVPGGYVGSNAPEVHDLTDMGSSTSYNTNSILTNSTGGAQQSIASGRTDTMNLNGIVDHKDAGKWNLIEAAERNPRLQCFMWRTNEAPEDGWEGEVLKGRVNVTSINDGIAPGNLITRDIAVNFDGAPTRVRAKPIAA